MSEAGNTQNFQLPHIVLSGMQNEAVDKIVDWYKVPINPRDVRSNIFYLAGYAGTGKTSIVAFIMDALGFSYSDVCFGTYTGKAALVLSDNIGQKVSTIHSLCYELVDDFLNEKSNKVEMVFQFRKNSPVKKSKLLVLDEVSMVNKDIMADLLKFGVKILVLGDPFQLAPVEGDAYFNEEYTPDFFLTEIHRQALENPIIMLSQQVRLGNRIAFGQYGDSVLKISYDDATSDLWLQADQVIVGTNKTRRSRNNWFRQELGYTEKNSKFPVVGDRLICLRNRWDDGMVNGMMLVATSDANVAHDRESFKLSFAQDSNSDDKLRFTNMNCSSSEVLGGIKLRMPYWEQKKLVNIDYSYAITCHKSQGSQYDDVLFEDEGFGSWLNDNTYYRHLYTAMTRTAKNLIIVE